MRLHKTLLPLVLGAACATALAKLPPLDDAAKAKAAEAAAKTAWSGKVEAFLLCKSQDRVAAHYRKSAGGAPAAAAKPGDPKAAAAKPGAAAAPASGCTDPGPFAYTPPAPAGAPAQAAAPAAPASPAAPAPAAAAKKS